MLDEDERGKILNELRFRLRALFRRKRMEQELHDELRFHFEQQVAKLVQRGVPPDEARRQARLIFGGKDQIKEECREARGVHLLETLIQDVRFGLRMLTKSPGFTLAVVLTLALGIGATTAMFSVVQGVMLSPLPYPDPEQLVLIWQSNPHAPHVSLSLPDLRDWQKSATSFQTLAGLRWYQFNLSAPGVPEHVSGYEVSAGFFEMLSLRPQLGRTFTAEEDQPSGTRVAVISDREWKTRFGGTDDVLGKSITLSGVAYTVIGVLPATFHFASPVEVYIPLGQGDPLYNSRRYPGVLGIGRLWPGITIAKAQAEMTAVQQRLDQAYPDTDHGLGTDVIPLKKAIVGNISATLLLMLGAVAAVLLIACANVANLLLARSATRTREFNIRAAIGASHWRIVRQLLTESLLLALAGGAIGLLFAKLGTRAVLTMLEGNLLRTEHVRLNGEVLLFSLGISIFVGILFGLAPAFRSRVTDLQAALKQATRGATATHHRTQNVLVVSQMAVTLVLLTGAALLFRTIHDMWQTNPGFSTQNLITFRVGLAGATGKTSANVRATYDELLRSIRAIPGVEAADSSNVIPLNQMSNFAPFWPGTRESTPLAEAPRMLLYWTGDDYLRAMGIPLLQGRYFTEQDRMGRQRVLVIDSVLAEKFFPGQNPIGQSITINLWGDARIVGVAGHIRHSGLGDPAALTQPQAYAPLAQIPDAGVPGTYGGLTLVVRTPLSIAALIPQIEEAVASKDSGQPIYDIHSMQQVVAESMTPQRFPMTLLSVFAAFALLLAALGTYAVISYSIVQRTAEIGVRMALGAGRSRVFQMVIGQGVRLAIIGVAIGAVAALALARALPSFSQLLYGVNARDPLTMALVAFILLGASLLACYLPARRAMNTDPMVALRHE